MAGMLMLSGVGGDDCGKMDFKKAGAFSLSP
jgi:hypothetical protein